MSRRGSSIGFVHHVPLCAFGNRTVELGAVPAVRDEEPEPRVVAPYAVRLLPPVVPAVDEAVRVAAFARQVPCGSALASTRLGIRAVRSRGTKRRRSSEAPNPHQSVQ